MFKKLHRILVKNSRPARRFSNQERIVRIGLYKILLNGFELRDLPEEAAKLIAAQAVNYLTCEDLAQTISRTASPDREILQEYAGKIIPLAHSTLEQDKSLRELLVCYLRVKTAMHFSSKGPQAWLESPEKSRIESILLKYGAEFPGAVDPNKFNELVLALYTEHFERDKPLSQEQTSQNPGSDTWFRDPKIVAARQELLGLPFTPVKDMSDNALRELQSASVAYFEEIERKYGTEAALEGVQLTKPSKKPTDQNRSSDTFSNAAREGFTEDGMMSEHLSQEVVERYVFGHYAAALHAVRGAGMASPGLLQRKLHISYQLSSALLDAMERKHIIGPADGARPRKLLD